MFLNIDVDSDFSDCISFKFYFKHQILCKNRPTFRAIRMRPCAGRAFIVETCLSSSQQRDRGQRMFRPFCPSLLLSLAIALAINVIKSVVSVRLFVPTSSFEPLTFIFCTCLGHNYSWRRSKIKVIGQGRVMIRGCKENNAVGLILVLGRGQFV